MDTIKVAILVEDTKSHEITIDIERMHVKDSSSYAELFSNAEQYYSRCLHSHVINVIKFDSCRISMSF